MCLKLCHVWGLNDGNWALKILEKSVAAAVTVFIRCLEAASSPKRSTCFCPRRKGRQTAKKETACLFPSSTHKRPISLRGNRSLISRAISTFLMILFDYDKLLNALIYFHFFSPVTSPALLTHVFTPQTNILSDLPIHPNCTTLSAPVDDLLPYPSLSVPPLSLLF